MARPSSTGPNAPSSQKVRYVPRPSELRELNFWSPTSMWKKTGSTNSQISLSNRIYWKRKRMPVQPQPRRILDDEWMDCLNLLDLLPKPKLIISQKTSNYPGLPNEFLDIVSLIDTALLNLSLFIPQQLVILELLDWVHLSTPLVT